MAFRNPATQTDVVQIGSLVGSTGTVIGCWAPPLKCKIQSLTLINGATIAAHSSNYGTFTVYNRGSTGSSTTSVGTLVTTSALTAHDPTDLTLSTTPAALYFEEGEGLAAKWLETGASRDLTLAQLTIEYIPTTANEV